MKSYSAVVLASAIAFANGHISPLNGRQNSVYDDQTCNTLLDKWLHENGGQHLSEFHQWEVTATWSPTTTSTQEVLSSTSASTSNIPVNPTSTISSTAASSTSTAIPSLNYLGCYTDTIAERGIADNAMYPRLVTGGMTPEVCQSYCSQFNAVIFGVEYGSECYCGDYLRCPSTKAPESECNIACQGDSTKICGGSNRMNVYGNFPPGSPPTCSSTITSSLAQSATSESSDSQQTTSVTTSPGQSTSKSSTPLVCNHDNCLRQIIQSSTLAAPFCATYTTSMNTATTSLPAYVTMCGGSPSRISSACSCLGTATSSSSASITTTSATTGVPYQTSGTIAQNTPSSGQSSAAETTPTETASSQSSSQTLTIETTQSPSSTTPSVPTSTLTTDTTSTSDFSSISTMSSLSSKITSSTSLTETPTSSSASGICTPVGAGQTIPQPSNGIDLLQVGPDDAPYSLTEAELLNSISFPNGLECRQNLVILFPGTAVPALDTFTSTFIPVFQDASVADADVMVVSNPSFSLGDAQTTAEYAAFAINYASLVLGRRATIIPWSQGNLNTQWALKYWPSTRLNLRNYVGMSPDYDGTVEISFLCDPERLFVGQSGLLLGDFFSAGIPDSLFAVLGIKALPTSGDEFKYYILGLLGGMTPNTTTDASTNSLTATTNSLTSILKARELNYAIAPNSQPRKISRVMQRDLHARVIESELGSRLAARQVDSGNPSALDQLLSGLLEPISQAFADLVFQPGSVLAQVLANVGGSLQYLQVPAVTPQGCLPASWQQTYFSNFVNTLATDYGNGAGDEIFVPTTTVFSITDEVVQPQGVTGYEEASGYLIGASNIFIQGNGGCSFTQATATDGLPTTITHEGVLYSGMGVQAAILAVKNGGVVTPDMIDPAIRCELIHPLLNEQQAAAQEATIPGALARILLGGGDQGLDDFLPAEPAVRGYATRVF